MRAPAADPVRIPLSTYRLQLNSAFPFAEAERLVPYLKRLGVTECYCSPILAARPGSPHCYDLCDHSRVNPDLGGEEGFRSFVTALRAADLGLVLDFVPNHMSVDPEHNLWWRSVLESGPSSPYSNFFDIDWDPVKSELKGKVLLPILGDQYGMTLENGQLRIEFADGFRLTYFDRRLPLNPRQLRLLLGHNLDALVFALKPGDAQLTEFQSVLFHLENLPAYTEVDPEKVELRRREKDIAGARLLRLIDESLTIRRHVDENVRLFNGRPGDSRSFDLLHALLEQQVYRLSSWRTAMHEINYRRFFDINELAGIRMEEPEVFRQTHVRIGEWIQNGDITGLRLDHIDGLFDPKEYLENLAGLAAHGVYTVVEKIRSRGELLATDWRVHGTTGYQFMNDLNGVYVDGAHGHEFRKLYQKFTRRRKLFHDVVYDSKELIVSTSMASELNVLAHELNRISESHRRFRDFTLDSLREALREIVACFPVYRTYFTPRGFGGYDGEAVGVAVTEALRRNPAMEPSIFHFIRQMLLPVPIPEESEEEFKRRAKFAMKFQQYTGPVQAKGVEDTAFYRYAPLLSLNEVGGEPARFGCPIDEFHRASEERLEVWPLGMLGTSTHDTKRGEDARARINVLSEIPAEWQSMLSRFARATATAKTSVGGRPAPDRSDEYLFYQALLGAWPACPTGEPGREFVDRMRDYMQKAVKEEKVHTSWINPSADYDKAVSRFVEQTLVGSNARLFLPLFTPFQHKISRLGMLNSLSHLVMKIASPGVPDFYRGTELWDLSLVDPDNRRPVDFQLRAEWLEQMEPLLDEKAPSARRIEGVTRLFEKWEDGRIKLYYTAAGLRLRRRRPEIFLRGSYLPLAAEGKSADRLIAFGRESGPVRLVAVGSRLLAGFWDPAASPPVDREIWSETSVILPPHWPEGEFRNLFTGERIPAVRIEGGLRLRADEALRHTPSAIFYREDQA